MCLGVVSKDCRINRCSKDIWRKFGIKVIRCEEVWRREGEFVFCILGFFVLVGGYERGEGWICEFFWCF